MTVQKAVFPREINGLDHMAWFLLLRTAREERTGSTQPPDRDTRIASENL
jgi:hypothetical protein